MEFDEFNSSTTFSVTSKSALWPLSVSIPVLVTVTLMSRVPSPTAPKKRSTGEISKSVTARSLLSISTMVRVSYCPSQPKLSRHPPKLYCVWPMTKSSAEFGPPDNCPMSTEEGRRPVTYESGLTCPPFPSESVTWTVVGKERKKLDVLPPAESVVFCWYAMVGLTKSGSPSPLRSSTAMAQEIYGPK